LHETSFKHLAFEISTVCITQPLYKMTGNIKLDIHFRMM